MIFFRSDGERSLNSEFSALMTELKITYEFSTSDILDQNEHSKKKGHLLAMKTKIMKIGAGLPTYLGSWIVQATDYLMNRTLMNKHDGKTSFEKILKKKPHLRHLRKYDCKSYSFDKHLLKKGKLTERAHIGFLLNYDNNNIFLIGIPSQKKVIRTKDVMFNEEEFYKQHEFDFLQLINEPMIEFTSFDVFMLFSFIIEKVDLNEKKDERINRTGLANIQKSIKSADEMIAYEADEAEKEIDANAGHFSILSLTSVNQSQLVQQFSSASESSNATQQSFNAIEESSNANHQSEAIGVIQTSEDGRRFEKFKPSVSASRDISFRVDESNVVSEEVKRTRHRKQLYAAAIDNAAAGSINVYHASFNAHIIVDQYYIQPINQKPNESKLAKQVNQISRARLHKNNMPSEPQYYHHLRNHFHVEGFRQVMKTEIIALQDKKTGTEIFHQSIIDAGKIPILTTGMFKYKFDNQGYFVKYKARLCARGDFQQIEQNIYAAILAVRIFRALMIIVNAFNLNIKQYDAVNAFVNNEINEFIYCKSSNEGTDDDKMLFFLFKTLYELKQSSALGYRHFVNFLNDFELKQVLGIECLFINDGMISFFFVNDIAVLYDRKYTKQVDEFQTQLFERYEMRYLSEIEGFLKIRVSRDRYSRFLGLCQDSYIEKLIIKFNINADITKKGPATPLAEDYVKNTSKVINQEIYAYQQKIGSINYAAVISRPDIAHAANKLSEFFTNSSRTHIKASNRVFIYLAYIKDFFILFNAQMNDSHSIFLVSSDASYADDIETRYSSQSYEFKLFNELIDGKTIKQKTITTSITEAELLAISSIEKEIIGGTRFFEQITFELLHIIVIECDNMQIIKMLINLTSQFIIKLRHVDVHRHGLNQKIRTHRINVKWISTSSILIDEFIKPLSPQRHKEFVRLIDLQKISVTKKNQEDEVFSVRTSDGCAITKKMCEMKCGDVIG